MAYIVKSGDTLSRIAAQNGMSLSQLLALNPQFQANPNLIRPGQSVNLAPAAAPVAPSNAPAPSVAPSGLYGTLIKNNPFLSDLLSDEATRTQYDSLPEDLQGIFLQTANSLGKAVESGKVVNPNIELTPAENKKLLDQASSELEPYYQEKLGLLRNDLTTSISRLTQDYEKAAGRSVATFKEKLATNDESEAQSGTAFSSGRKERLDRTIDLQNQALEDASTATIRGAQDVATSFEKQAGSDALRSLVIPGITTYSASATGMTPSGSRSVYSPLGNVALGEIGKEKTTAIAGRKSQLEETFRKNRLLDLSTL